MLRYCGVIVHVSTLSSGLSLDGGSSTLDYQPAAGSMWLTASMILPSDTSLSATALSGDGMVGYQGETFRETVDIVDWEGGKLAGAKAKPLTEEELIYRALMTGTADYVNGSRLLGTAHLERPVAIPVAVPPGVTVT